MQPIRLKFAIQGADDTLSGATDTTVDELALNWIRFTAPLEILKQVGIAPDPSQAKESRIVMFIDLHPDQAPIRATGSISWYEKAPGSQGDEYSVVVDFQEITEQDRQKIKGHLSGESKADAAVEDRRAQLNRESDLFLLEIGRMLGILVDMSEGKSMEFSEQFANLVGLKTALGRRKADDQLEDDICVNIERIACNLARLLGATGGLRKVRIRKLTGKAKAAVRKDKVFVGWEEAPPRTGRSYCLYLEGGGIFRSAEVTDISEDQFRTRNSVYEIQGIET